MNKKLENFSNFLIIIFPILMVSGPLLPEIALAILVISFFVLSSYEEKIKYFKIKIFLLFIIFWLILILISLLNQNLTSLLKSLSYLRFGLFFISIQFLMK